MALIASGDVMTGTVIGSITEMKSMPVPVPSSFVAESSTTDTPVSVGPGSPIISPVSGSQDSHAGKPFVL